MTKTLNQIIFCSPPQSEYFFQQHWESEYVFRKKQYPPFKLNDRSLNDCELLLYYSPSEGTVFLYLTKQYYSKTVTKGEGKNMLNISFWI
jgi:hypothetical protein